MNFKNNIPVFILLGVFCLGTSSIFFEIFFTGTEHNRAEAAYSLIPIMLISVFVFTGQNQLRVIALWLLRILFLAYLIFRGERWLDNINMVEKLYLTSEGIRFLSAYLFLALYLKNKDYKPKFNELKLRHRFSFPIGLLWLAIGFEQIFLYYSRLTEAYEMGWELADYEKWMFLFGWLAVIFAVIVLTTSKLDFKLNRVLLIFPLLSIGGVAYYSGSVPEFIRLTLLYLISFLYLNNNSLQGLKENGANNHSDILDEGAF